jgi:hypothetical protein
MGLDWLILPAGPPGGGRSGRKLKYAARKSKMIPGPQYRL